MKFAVVDLETTGSSYKKGDRIIQFACSFIEGNEIKDSVEIKINPERTIPHKIELLTGVKNKMVKQAPYFFEVGQQIKHMLEGYVFVAHNVNFDFKFINYELERAGLTALDMKAMDTVLISRILFPQLKSYSLQNLSDDLGLSLEQAHDAEEDAKATARLLLQSMKKAKSIPDQTLQQLVELSQASPYQTADFFAYCKQEADKQKKSEEGIIYANQLALKDCFHCPSTTSESVGSYPQTAQAKEEQFAGKIKWRPAQVEMMDRLDRYWRQDQGRHFLLQAPAGSGKSMAYLLPAAYLNRDQGPVVISTYSLVLQDQLVDHHIRLLDRLLDRHSTVAVLKSQRHYVDLESVDYLLKQDSLPPSYANYLAQLLVWLTETETGNLDEVVNIKHKHPFWQWVRSSKHPNLLAKGPWSDLDYYLLSRRKAKQADFIVTNHAYLCQHYFKEQEDVFDSAYFILDEGHHFMDQLLQVSTLRFSFSSFHFDLKECIDQIKMTHFQSLKDSLKIDRQGWLTQLEEAIQASWFEWLQLDQSIQYSLKLKIQADSAQQAAPYSKSLSFHSLVDGLEEEIKAYHELFAHLYDSFQQLLSIYLDEYIHWSVEDQLLLDDFYASYNKMSQAYQSFYSIFIQKQASTQSWASLKAGVNEDQLLFYSFSNEHYQNYLSQLMALDQLVYVSAEAYTIQQLYQEVEGAKALESFSCPSPFDYKNQTALVLPKDLIAIKSLDEDEYIHMLVYYLNIILSQNHQASLVLFNSLKTLDQVYQALSQLALAHERPLLSQTDGASKNRLLKSFKKLKQPILLGAQSFWEGIDLAEDALTLVVVTRLPFDSPDDVWQQVRLSSLNIAENESFYRLSLVRAKQKLSQAFGRLIRSSQDKGMMVLLDDRFIHSSYAFQLQSALPADCPIYQLSDDQLGQLDRFFENKENR